MSPLTSSAGVFTCTLETGSEKSSASRHDLPRQGHHPLLLRIGCPARFGRRADGPHQLVEERLGARASLTGPDSSLASGSRPPWMICRRRRGLPDTHRRRSWRQRRVRSCWQDRAAPPDDVRRSAGTHDELGQDPPPGRRGGPRSPSDGADRRADQSGDRTGDSGGARSPCQSKTMGTSQFYQWW